MRTMLDAASLVDDMIEHGPGLDDAERAYWMRLGFAHGRDVERAAMLDEISAAREEFRRWRAAMCDAPEHAEMMRRRYPPDGDRWRWAYHGENPCPSGWTACAITHAEGQPPPPSRPIRVTAWTKGADAL